MTDDDAGGEGGKKWSFWMTSFVNVERPLTSALCRDIENVIKMEQLSQLLQ